MMFELIPFACSRMVLLAGVSAKWINFDYLILTSFDYCKSLIAACSQDSHNYCSPHIGCIFNLYMKMHVRRIFADCLRYVRCIFNLLSRIMFATYSLNIRRLLTQSIRRRPNLQLANIPQILVSHIRLCLLNNRRVLLAVPENCSRQSIFFRKGIFLTIIMTPILK